MASQWLQYKTDLVIDYGGYDGEVIGSNGSSDWQGAPENQPVTCNYSYWYTDNSATGSGNVNSTRVTVTVDDTWYWSIDSQNTATITITTKVTKIERTLWDGTPTNIPRDISIYNYKGGTEIFHAEDTPTGTDSLPSNILALGGVSGDLVVAQRTITIPANTTGVGGSSLYYFNHTSGTPWEPRYMDAMYLGTTFRNLAPPDYRPGATWNGSSWMSHNRNGGGADIYDGATWRTMRTVNGGEASGDPPEIWHSPTTKKNMRLIGNS